MNEMKKPGPKPMERIETAWSPRFAYAIGLLATDGCLSPPGNLISFTSKDREQVENLSRALRLNLSVGTKSSGGSGRMKRYFRVQFRNALFYKFLVSIGLTPAKSKTLGRIHIPHRYFFDFLRGVFDGDGSAYSYWDKRWRSSFMFYLSFASASESFIDWIREEIRDRLSVGGHITCAKGSSCLQLKYSKNAAAKILREMYRNPRALSLSRKRLKVARMLI